MSRSLRDSPRLYSAGDKQIIRAADLTEATLREGNRITIFSEQVEDDKVAWWGHGGYPRDRAPTVFKYGDLVEKSSQNAINGTIYAVIADSDGDPLAREPINDLDALREMVSEDRTEREEQPAQEPAANSARYLELQVEAGSGSDGVTVDSTNSELKLHYTTA